MLSDEEAKAVQEVAKATGKAIEAMRDLGEFAGKLIGPAWSGLGDALGDRVRAWHAHNWLSALDGARGIHQARGTEDRIEPIPPRIAFALMDGASKEDDPTIQAMWSALIANASDPDRADRGHARIFGQILSQMQPPDAQLLQYVCARFRDAAPGTNLSVNFVEAQHVLDLSVDTVNISAENLTRLGCLAASRVEHGIVFSYEGDVREFRSVSGDRYTLTALGASLVEACSAG